METQGKSGKAFRTHYKDKIGLKDKEANVVAEIAAECERETAKVDAKAQRLIEAARARVPNGQVVSTCFVSSLTATARVKVILITSRLIRIFHRSFAILSGGRFRNARTAAGPGTTASADALTDVYFGSEIY